MFNMGSEDDAIEAKTRDKANNMAACLTELYNELRALVKYNSGKTAEDAWDTFTMICNDHGIDPVGE